MKKKGVVLLCFITIATATFAAFQKYNTKHVDTTKYVDTTEYVDIYDTVKEAFLTDKGYTGEIPKHMSQEVFKRTNIYNAYNVNNPEYKKPFKVIFQLKKGSQKKENDKIYVTMTYSVEIKDSKDKTVGGSWNIPITFTVKKDGDNWYIIDKDEPA